MCGRIWAAWIPFTGTLCLWNCVSCNGTKETETFKMRSSISYAFPNNSSRDFLFTEFFVCCASFTLFLWRLPVFLSMIPHRLQRKKKCFVFNRHNHHRMKGRKMNFIDCKPTKLLANALKVSCKSPRCTENYWTTLVSYLYCLVWNGIHSSISYRLERKWTKSDY